MGLILDSSSGEGGVAEKVEVLLEKKGTMESELFTKEVNFNRALKKGRRPEVELNLVGRKRHRSMEKGELGEIRGGKIII